MEAEFYFPAGKKLFLSNLKQSMLPGSQENAKMEMVLVCVPQTDGTFHINLVESEKPTRQIPREATPKEIERITLAGCRSFSIKVKLTKLEVANLLRELFDYLFMLANQNVNRN